MIDLFLSPKEVASLLGITAQGVHKICKELNLETKHGTKRKVYPDQLRKILDYRGSKFPKGKKIAFHNLKGGVGKTTMAHALGSRCSALGFKTLLIDADKQSNLTSTFGIDAEKLDVKTIKDLFEDYYLHKKPLNFDSAIIGITDYLDLIPATLELANLDLSIQHHCPAIDKVFSKILAPIKSEYDLIIFDLAPDFNRTTLSIHAFCDTAIIPVTLGKFALTGVSLTYKHIDYVKDEYSKDVDRHIVINKFDARHSLTLAQKLSDLYKEELFPVVVPVANIIENNFLEDKNIWDLSKSKCAALDGYDMMIDGLFGIDDLWNKGNLSKSSNKTPSSRLGAEAHV